MKLKDLSKEILNNPNNREILKTLSNDKEYKFFIAGSTIINVDWKGNSNMETTNTQKKDQLQQFLDENNLNENMYDPEFNENVKDSEKIVWKSSMKKQKNIEIAQKIVDILDDVYYDRHNYGLDEGWHNWGNGFINGKTNIKYKGLNFYRLYAETVRRSYRDNRWLTFNQVKSLGGSIIKGCKGTELMYFTIWDKKEKDYFNREKLISSGLTPDEMEKYIEHNVYGVIKPFYVFNVEQCNNLNLEKLPSSAYKPFKLTDEMNSRTNLIVNDIIKNSEAKIYYDEENRVYQGYNPKTDTIHLPEIKKFESMEGYYSAVLHEILHSTGHSTRLNRDLTGRFGTPSDLKEGVIEELSLVMLMGQANFNFKRANEANHVQYITAWLEGDFSKDKWAKELLSAINSADKATKYICDKYISKELINDTKKEPEQEFCLGI